MIKNVKLILYTIFILIVFFLLFYCCHSLANFLPVDRLYYPGFGNGYEKNIKFEININKKENVITGELEKLNSFICGEPGILFISIKIYNLENNCIATYQKDYLNNERNKNNNPDNEFWVAYEDGLILIPEEFHNEGKWQQYIKDKKGK